jgi:transcriptional regulator with XRE-family HTH domain
MADDRETPFNRWLRTRLASTQLTQRQLALKSGVDHSTISRLVRGERVPSLQTATRLARSLDWDAGLPVGSDEPRPNRVPTATVEYALRSDPLLDEDDVRRIMHGYVAVRNRRLLDGPLADSGRTGSAPVPIVVEVPGPRSR